MTSSRTKKSILVVSGDYSVDGEGQWLPEELAREFRRRGHDVRVIARDLLRPRPVGVQPTSADEPEVFSVGVTAATNGRISRRLRLPLALWRQRRSAVAWALEKHYDLVVYHTIAWTSSAVVRRLKRRGVVGKSVLILWDFFPVHQYSIGHISQWLRPLQPLLYRLEARAVSAADTVAVMSRAGQTFLARYFPSASTDVILVPPWGQDSDVRATPPARFRAVFGGQLGAGRGLEDLIEAAEVLARTGVDGEIVIYGDGPLVPWLRSEIERRGLDNLILGGKLTRDEYAAAIAQASVGIAATVQGVPSPSFPSKIVDYARIGLPVVASMEESTDVGEILCEAGAGWSARAGHPDELAAALVKAAASQRDGTIEQYSRRSRKFFEDELRVQAAADRLLKIVEDEDAEAKG